MDSMVMTGDPEDPIDMTVWVTGRVMAATEMAAIVNTQTPSKLVEGILMDYLRRGGFLRKPDQVDPKT